jgi:hypothetical protein
LASENRAGKDAASAAYLECAQTSEDAGQRRSAAAKTATYLRRAANKLGTVLIMPPDRPPVYRLSRREKWMLSGVLGGVAALAVVLVISFVTTGPSAGHGCIYATIPGAVGAEQVHECGASARQTCRTVNAPGAYTRQAAGTLAAECRKAALPVG